MEQIERVITGDLARKVDERPCLSKQEKKRSHEEALEELIGASLVPVALERSVIGGERLLRR